MMTKQAYLILVSSKVYNSSYISAYLKMLENYSL